MPLSSLLPLFGISITLQRRFGLGSASALMTAVAGWLLLVFIGGLAGHLRPFAAGVWLFGGVLFAVSLPGSLARLRSEGPGVVYPLFALFCGAFWLVHHDSQYFYFDEYGHWGIYLRDMWASDAFWQADSNALHRRYPPGAPLWQYAFTVFAPKVDASAYLAQFVLLVTPLMILFEGLSWRRPGWIAAITLACVAGIANFGHGVASLYVDHLVSTWFAGVLLAFMRTRSPGLARVAALALPLLVLTLLKDAGVAFTLAAVGIIAALLLADRWPIHGAARAVAFALAASVLLAAPSMAALGAWSANRDAAGIEKETQSLGGVIRGVIDGERALDEDASDLISQRFREVFLHQQLAKDAVSAQFNAFSVPMMPLFEARYRVSTAGFYLLFGLFFLALLALTRPRGQVLRWSLLATGALGTALTYSAVLYLSYLFAFGERGLILSSYIRYTHSAALALLLIAVAALSPSQHLLVADTGHRRRALPIGGIAMGVLLAWLFVFETPYLRNFHDENPRLEARVATDPLMRDVRDALGDRTLWIYFPVDRPNGFLGHLMQFQLAPTPTTIERSPAFVDQPAERIVAELADYDMLWFPASNAEADAKMAAALGVTLSNRFVEPHTDADGVMRFRPYPLARNTQATNGEGDH